MDSSDDEIVAANKLPTSRKSMSTPSKSVAILSDDDNDGDSDYVAAPTSQKPDVCPTLRNRRSNGRHTPPVEITDDEEADLIAVQGKSEEDLEPELTQVEAPDEFSAWVAKARELGVQNQDVIVNVLVTSRMPDTIPLLAKRKLGQGMKLVLDTWVAQQRSKAGVMIPDDVAEKLFMTWKGNKVYNHSTAASLGVQVDAQGNLRGDSGDGFHKGGLLLEVWTDEAYADFLRERERKRALKLGISDDANDWDVERELPPVQERRKGIKVILKAREHEPVKISIHDNTTVSDLMQAFRAQRDVAAGSNLSIYFDGEKLDDDSLVKDADIDPDDTNQLEVHIR